MVYTRKLSKVRLQALPKILLHEHIDCSLRPQTVLDLWRSGPGFAQSDKLPFPSEIVSAWEAAGNNQRKRAAAGHQYQRFIAGHASASLKNYLDAIGLHLLPVMQTADSLYRITKERIEDAVADGIVAMRLRFAPQLHLKQGLKLSQVMESVIQAVDQSPIPVNLMVCCLRHENGRMARRLADLAIKYRQHVQFFDLAGWETGFPGLLPWWLKQAAYVRQFGIRPSPHLWETEEPTDRDLELLEQYGIDELAHGIRGDRQDKRVCTVCVGSNVVTGQFKKFADHNADELFESGVNLTIDTDGTLFTQTDLTNEYFLFQRHFGWGLKHFGRCNFTALKQMVLPRRKRQELKTLLTAAYAV